MGAARNHENPNEGHGYIPKLILAGRLTGTLDGRPVVIEAGEYGLLLTMSSLRTAWAARRTAAPLIPFLRALKQAHVPVKLRLAGFVSVDLLPRPSAMVRWLSPELAGLG